MASSQHMRSSYLNQSKRLRISGVKLVMTENLARRQF